MYIGIFKLLENNYLIVKYRYVLFAQTWCLDSPVKWWPHSYKKVLY